MPGREVSVFMMRDVSLWELSRLRFENKKPIWASDRFRLRERSWFASLAGDAHPSFRSIHRGRSRPGWRNRLLEGRLVPDAGANVSNLRRSSRLFFRKFTLDVTSNRHRRP